MKKYIENDPYNYTIEVAKNLLEKDFPYEWEDIAHDVFINFMLKEKINNYRMYIYQGIHNKRKHICENQKKYKEVNIDDVKLICKLEYSDVKKHLNKAFRNLSNREKLILYDRFHLGYTLEETGQRQSVSRERIRQIEKKALRKLRHPHFSKLLKQSVEIGGPVILPTLIIPNWQKKTKIIGKKKEIIKTKKERNIESLLIEEQLIKQKFRLKFIRQRRKQLKIFAKINKQNEEEYLYLKLLQEKNAEKAKLIRKFLVYNPETNKHDKIIIIHP